MGKFKYLVSRVKNMNFSNMIDTIKNIHKESGKNSIYLFFDMLNCGNKYMAGYVDYQAFKMYNLSKKQREKFITRGINNNYVKELNDIEKLKTFSSKLYFNKNYSEFLKRDWIYINECTLEKFIDFTKKHKEIIIKPTNEMCGKGVYKITIDDNTNIEKLYNNLKETDVLVEECIISAKEIAKFNPKSLNTIRVVTIKKNGKVNIMFTGLKLGNGKEVDNFNNHGLLTFVDSDGVIRRKAVDKYGKTYDTHPLTGEKIQGFKIPRFEDAKKIAIDCATKIEGINYIGFDIAITDSGVLIIEANPYPGYDLYQSVPDENGNFVGLKDFFDKIIYGKNNLK